MNKILLTAFKGNDNSSKVLIDKINDKKCIDKLYLENDFLLSEKQLKEQLKYKEYDLIICFGQKPVIKSICIEILAHIENIEYKTNYEYIKLIEYLKLNNISVKTSNKPGNYLCNNIYFKALELLNMKKINTKIIFIHIPYLKNILDIDNLSKTFEEYFKKY